MKVYKGGLYNYAVGEDLAADCYLKTLGLDRDEISRYRDICLHNNQISILTRTGGNNRHDHQNFIKKMKQHPRYLSDQDEEEDKTYMWFFFSVPEESNIPKPNRDELWPRTRFLKFEQALRNPLRAKQFRTEILEYVDFTEKFPDGTERINDPVGYQLFNNGTPRTNICTMLDKN